VGWKTLESNRRMNLPSFPDLKAETKQAALRSPRTWAAPLVILLLFIGERCPLPEAAGLLFISIIVQLAVWYHQWHPFEEKTYRRILQKHIRQFEGELIKENERNSNRDLKKVLKSYQVISAGNSQNQQISETDVNIQRGIEEQIRAVTQVIAETKHSEMDAATEDAVETALKTLERLAAIRSKTQDLKQQQGIAEEAGSTETPLETLKRVSGHLQHQTEVEEEMQKLILRVQDRPETTSTEPPARGKQTS